MNIGSLDTRIVIEVATEAQDAAGQPIQTWTIFRKVWSRRMTTRSRERLASRADQELAVRMTTFRIRWFKGVHERMRVVDDGSNYDIIGIADNRREGWLELSCQTLNPASTGSA